MDTHNAALGAMTTAMAWIVSQHIDEEDFISQFVDRLRGSIHEVRTIVAEYEKINNPPTEQ